MVSNNMAGFLPNLSHMNPIGKHITMAPNVANEPIQPSLSSSIGSSLYSPFFISTDMFDVHPSTAPVATDPRQTETKIFVLRTE